MNIKIGNRINSANGKVVPSNGQPLDVMLGAAINTLTIPQIMAGLGGWMTAGNTVTSISPALSAGSYTRYFAFKLSAIPELASSEIPYRMLSGSNEGAGIVVYKPTGTTKIRVGVKFDATQIVFADLPNDPVEGVTIAGGVSYNATTDAISVRSTLGNTTSTSKMAFTDSLVFSCTTVAYKAPLLLTYTGTTADATMDAVVAGGTLPPSPVFQYSPPTQGDYNGTAVRSSAGQATIASSYSTFWTIEGVAIPVYGRLYYDYVSGVLYRGIRGGVFGSVNGDTLSLAGLRAAPNPNNESFTIVVSNLLKSRPTATTSFIGQRVNGIGYTYGTYAPPGQQYIGVLKDGTNRYIIELPVVSDTIAFSWNHITNTLAAAWIGGETSVNTTLVIPSSVTENGLSNSNGFQCILQRCAIIPQALSLAQCQAVVANRTIAGYTPEIDIRPNDCPRTDNQVTNFGSLGGFATLTDQTTSDWRGQRFYRQDRMIL